MNYPHSIRRLLISILVLTFALTGAASAQDEYPGKLLFENAYFPEWVDSIGQVAYFKYVADPENRAAYARLAIGDPATGKETVLFPDIDFTKGEMGQAFTFMPDGRHVLLVDNKTTKCDIWIYDSEHPYRDAIRLTELEQFDPGYTDDQMYQLGMRPNDALNVKLLDMSPDGKRIIFNFGILGKSAIYMYELERNRYRQMTPDRYGGLPKWFPDSERFVYSANDSISGKFSVDLYVMEATTNKSSVLVATELSESWATPSPDGKYVAFIRLKDGLHWDVWVVRVEDGKTAQITDLPPGHSCGQVIWNGDGTKLIAAISGYVSKITSLFELDFDPSVFD
jgi:Tol biopolymer transport system component